MRWRTAAPIQGALGVAVLVLSSCSGHGAGAEIAAKSQSPTSSGARRDIAEGTSCPRVRIEIHPHAAPIGTRAYFTGCAPPGRRHTAFSVSLSGWVGPDGQITRSSRGARCRLYADAPGSARVRRNGSVFGYFRVPFRGECGPVRPGLYRVELGCRTCSFARFRVTGRRMRASPEGYLTFHSAAEAARRLDRYLNLPVVLPSPLPPGTSLQAKKGAWISAYGGRGTAEIQLRTDEGLLILDYGASGFDGCGGDDADVVWIHGKRGLITVDHYGRRPWSQVVWPVKPGHVDGTYGVAGNVSRDEALALARSMQVAIDAANGPDPGC